MLAENVRNFEKIWNAMELEKKLESMATLILGFPILNEDMDKRFLTPFHGSRITSPFFARYEEKLILRMSESKKGNRIWNPFESIEDAFMLLDAVKEKGYSYSLTNQDGFHQVSIFPTKTQEIIYTHDSNENKEKRLLEDIVFCCMCASMNLKDS